jgi:hypothetical protein
LLGVESLCAVDCGWIEAAVRVVLMASSSRGMSMWVLDACCVASSILDAHCEHGVACMCPRMKPNQRGVSPSSLPPKRTFRSIRRRECFFIGRSVRLDCLETDGDRRAHAKLAAGLDRAVVRLDDPTREREAETDTARATDT